MIGGIKIIEYNLIVNFILFILLLVFGVLAYNAEKENSSIRYSPEKADRYCYPDIMCSEPSTVQNSQVNFSIANYSSSLTDQDITFQYYNNDGDISEQIFNIYLGPSSALPAGVDSYLGLCAGYKNYSSTGTSIYLYYYYNNNGASWNTDNIAALFSLAFNGTSSYADNTNKLLNQGEDYLTYSINNTFTGLSVFSTETGPSGLININSNSTLTLAPISGQPNNPPVSNIMSYYQNAVKVSRFGASPGNSDHRRCIDPSYASQFNCGIHITGQDDDTHVYYNENTKLYVSKDNITATGLSPCKLLEGESPYNNDCGVPFCYAGSRPTNNAKHYQTNQFNTTGEVKSDAPTYLYKGKNIFDSDGVYSGAGSDEFNSYVQAQGLLFCGGTTTTTNNSKGTAYSNDGEFPKETYSGTCNIPEMANQPNRPIVDGNKVILGFK